MFDILNVIYCCCSCCRVLPPDARACSCSSSIRSRDRRKREPSITSSSSATRKAEVSCLCHCLSKAHPFSCSGRVRRELACSLAAMANKPMLALRGLECKLSAAAAAAAAAANNINHEKESKNLERTKKTLWGLVVRSYLYSSSYPYLLAI